MKKIIVTGANGQLGSEFQHLAPQFPELEFHFTDRNEADILDASQMQSLFKSNAYAYCINCAAYTAVDKAETEQELAQRLNVTGVQNLVDACKIMDTHFVHFSSDYVYHLDTNTPLKESDKTIPQGVYAQTKLDGEMTALKAHKKTTVIRTSWVYSSFGHNFVKTMLRLGRERDSLNIVYDQVGTPTYARHLAQAVLDIISRQSKGEIEAPQLNGLFNYSNEGVTSWYDFAMAVFEWANISCDVSAIESKDYPTPAKRPLFSLMNKDKFKQTFGVKIPHWREGLKDCLKELGVVKID